MTVLKRAFMHAVGDLSPALQAAIVAEVREHEFIHPYAQFLAEACTQAGSAVWGDEDFEAEVQRNLEPEAV